MQDLIEHARKLQNLSARLVNNDDAAITWTAATALESAQREIGELREAMAPFAAMGRLIEARACITFGKNPPDSEILCESSGEVGMGILTMGHFRDAAALLPNARWAKHVGNCPEGDRCGCGLTAIRFEARTALTDVGGG